MHPIQFHEINFAEIITRNYAEIIAKIITRYSEYGFRAGNVSAWNSGPKNYRPLPTNVLVRHLWLYNTYSFLLTWPWYLMQDFAISHEIHVLEKMLRKIEWN